MTTLANLRPTTWTIVKRIVEDADIDTTDWTGNNDSHRNGRWSFGGKGEPTLLFIWWGALKQSPNGQIAYESDMYNYAAELRIKRKGNKASKADEFHNRCLTAFYNKAPVRVAILDGLDTDDEEDRVDARELDEPKWYVTDYNESTSKMLIVRGDRNVGTLVPKQNEEPTPPPEPTLPEQPEPTPPDESTPPQRQTSGTTTFARDSDVVRQAKERANGVCEYCGQQGFETAQGGFYLEAHHVIPLGCDGHDKVWNVVAICPDDHKKAHFSIDRKKIRDKLIQFLGAKYQALHSTLLDHARKMDADVASEELLETDMES